MSRNPRIGVQVEPGDPFWVQVRELMAHYAQTLSIDLIEVALRDSETLSAHAQDEIIEDLVVQEIDALICNIRLVDVLKRILDHNIPIVFVSEIGFRHPRLISRTGLYDAAYMLGSFVHEKLQGRSAILTVGGLRDEGDTGHSRFTGFRDALQSKGEYTFSRVPSDWDYADAFSHVSAYLHDHPTQQYAAIFGMSDPLALAARDVLETLGGSQPKPLIVGINGDPLALAAIVDGRIAATVETDVQDIARQAVNTAYRAAQGEITSPHFTNAQRLVTAENVAEVAMRKLIALADLPSRFVGVNQRKEQQRVIQLETSQAIDRNIGAILDQQQLVVAISALIRDNYGFDRADVLLVRRKDGWLIEAMPGNRFIIRPDPAQPLGFALANNQVVFVPDVHSSKRFSPDPTQPATRTRVVVPIHQGGQIVGMLDLHRNQTAHYGREELDGLQLLADQLGIAIRNTELYGQALEGQATAEKADRLKTALLANVSHELRTPLNIILGYSRVGLEASQHEHIADPAQIHEDFGHIQRSGEHLLRLINDLLDLSRAEIGELDLIVETIDTRFFLEEVFRSSSFNFGRESAVTWHLSLPSVLPPIIADKVRLRQVLLNLLHNAHKFTRSGQITLSAEAIETRLHLWVTDTGSGITTEHQEHIFEPFFSVEGDANAEGIGLGLSIARRLIALHGGQLTLESGQQRGSTFHIYLPLPDAEGSASRPEEDEPRALLLIATAKTAPADLLHLAAQRGLTLHLLNPDDDLAATLEMHEPALLVWDVTTPLTNDWNIIRQINANPQLLQLPLILYRREQATMPRRVATGVLLKPLSDNALSDAIDGLGTATRHGSILIVEDDADTRALHRRIIGEHLPRYIIQDVPDGRRALNILARDIPSLVILDLMLPDIDGFAVLEALRADPRTYDVPVLILSGRTLSPDDIRRLNETRVVFQTKDVLSAAELAESLRRTLTNDSVLPPHTSILVKRAIAFIQQNHSESLSLQSIAEAVGISKAYLSRIFRQELGLALWEYLTRYRVARAKTLLLTTDYSIAEVAAKVGFDTATYFSTIFQREVGLSPRKFRLQHSDK